MCCDGSQVIIKNKRKETKVFCGKCGKLLRFATKADKEILKKLSK